MSSPRRHYTIALIVIGFFLLVSIGETALMALHPPGSQQSKLAFEIVTFISSMFLVVILLILLILHRWPEQGGILLSALNIILMFSVPFGTALGIYYFMKVNKPTDQTLK